MTRHRSTAAQTGRLRTYRPDIQGLRAVAIMMVVTMHVGILDIHGGVDVSFVLSGFLIGSQLIAEIDRTGRVSLSKFWARRMRRLAPGMAVVVITTAAVAWLYASPLRFRTTMKDGLSAALSFMNWRLVETGTDYFAGDGTQSPYQHFWSLGIEEQFYLAAPVVLVVTVWLSRRILRNRVLLGLFLTAVVGGSLYLSVEQTASNQPLAYFGTQTRVWELASGILLALGAPLLSRMNQGLAAVITWAGLATTIGTALLITKETPLPGYAVAGPVLGACMIIAGGCAHPRLGVETILHNPVTDYIGNVSYGWYLWHWPILVLWPNVVGRDMTYSDRFRVLSLSFILAVVMYYVVELRFRNNAQLVATPWKGICAGGTATAGAAAATACAMFVPLNLATSASAASGDAAGYSGAGSVKQAVLHKELSATAQSALPGAPKDMTHYGCIDNTDVKTFVLRGNCVIGDRSGRKTIVVIGDSHAWQWGDAFNALGASLHAKVVTMAKGGCSPEVYAIKNPELNREYAECDSWRESAFKSIEDLKPDVIVVSSRIRREVTEKGAEEAFERFEASGARLLYLTDTPQPGRNVPDCLATHLHDVSACNPTQDQAIEYRDHRATEQRVAEAHGAEVIDTLPAFCASGVCPAVIADQIVYFDASHITAGYAKSLVPFLRPTVQKALAG
ncbi:acyltransferase [Streptomyces incarnatus]|uniref:Acyltransferase n=1 Tax=Streptomyces incarnatus TaxID=665007 RepID=A0ABM5TK27_9ACTN|nr:acyltransferase family protein [Streptomyces incarnatus]AKJ11364.1 acyltransferase [Streptomyces incarnatus]